MPQILEFRNEIGTLADILEGIRTNLQEQMVHTALLDIAPDDGDPATERFYCESAEEFGCIVLMLAVRLLHELPDQRSFRFSAILVVGVDEANPEHRAALAIVKHSLKAQVLPEQLEAQQRVMDAVRQQLQQALSSPVDPSPVPFPVASSFPMSKPKIIS